MRERFPHIFKKNARPRKTLRGRAKSTARILRAVRLFFRLAFACAVLVAEKIRADYCFSSHICANSLMRLVPVGEQWR